MSSGEVSKNSVKKSLNLGLLKYLRLIHILYTFFEIYILHKLVTGIISKYKHIIYA